MIYSKEIDVRYEVDVFVAGGGVAGVAAAVCAARCGKRVFLAEARGSFGGAVASGLVPSIGPYFDGVKVAVGGFGYEMRKRISPNVPIEMKWTPFKVEDLKKTLDDTVREAGVEFSFFTTLSDVVVDDGVVKYAILTAKSGLFAVKADVFIDCTGDLDLVAFGGGKYELGSESGDIMPSTLCSLWAGIDFSKRVTPDDRRIEDAIEGGIFTLPDRHLPGMVVADERRGVGGGNIGHTFDTDSTDERSLTCAMIQGRSYMKEYERYFKEYLSGFEDMTLVYTADYLGIRESRRAVCDYMLGLEDFLRRASFPDEIGRYFYEVDMHGKSTDKAEYERFLREYERDYKYAPGESYGIPYRSLIPISFKNVLVAGRCIGVDRHMQASIRVVPGCFITGQAAGVAAAMAVDGNVRGVNIEDLRLRLNELGAMLPEVKDKL